MLRSRRNLRVSATIRETSITAKVAWQTKLFINVISCETFSEFILLYIYRFTNFWVCDSLAELCRKVLSISCF